MYMNEEKCNTDSRVYAFSNFLMFLIFALFYPCITNAGKADVTDVHAEYKGHSRFTFHVTVSHPDEGWSHYVDRWEIRTTDNKILAARPLRHPHVNEQSFTRFLPNVPIPDSVKTVVIHAHCSKDDYGGKTVEVVLKRDE